MGSVVHMAMAVAVPWTMVMQCFQQQTREIYAEGIHWMVHGSHKCLNAQCDKTVSTPSLITTLTVWNALLQIQGYWNSSLNISLRMNWCKTQNRCCFRNTSTHRSKSEHALLTVPVKLCWCIKIHTSKVFVSSSYSNTTCVQPNWPYIQQNNYGITF
jgi:3-methyladenine DNA glycosylase Mpg